MQEVAAKLTSNQKIKLMAKDVGVVSIVSVLLAFVSAPYFGAMQMLVPNIFSTVPLQIIDYLEWAIQLYQKMILFFILTPFFLIFSKKQKKKAYLKPDTKWDWRKEIFIFLVPQSFLVGCLFLCIYFHDFTFYLIFSMFNAAYLWIWLERRSFLEYPFKNLSISMRKLCSLLFILMLIAFQIGIYDVSDSSSHPCTLYLNNDSKISANQIFKFSKGLLLKNEDGYQFVVWNSISSVSIPPSKSWFSYP